VIRPLLATLVLVLAPAAALAQATPPQTPVVQASPVPSPSAAPSAAPSPYFPALGNNDPCTSLSAIVTRPTVSNSVCTVRPNHVLIESGYQNTTASGGGNAVVYPQTLIRAGTAVPALEFDLAPPSAARTNVGGVTVGTTDIGAGLKYVFGYTPKFNYGGQIFVTAPTGLNGFSAGGAQTTYALQAGYTLTPVFSVTGVTQMASLANGAARWSSFIPSLVLSASLPNSTGLFAEVAQFSHATGAGTPTRTQYIFGAFRDLGQRLQLDTSVGISPTASTGKYHYISVGGSYYL
jgi:hypothetical protein